MVPTDAKTPLDETVSAAHRATLRGKPMGAITAGLVAQVAGVGWEALWHAGLSAWVEDLGLPSSLGFLGDHIVSNLGVLSLLGSAGWLLVRKHAWRRGAVLAVSAGAVLQTAGAAWDLAGHVRGSENNPVPYALLGLGFVLAAGGLLAARRQPAARD